jgi:hypothetical protein
MFKKCQNCEQSWETFVSFLSDTNVQFIGYQARFDQARAGLFLFNHVCNTCIAIPVSEFEDLAPEKMTELSFVPHSHGCPGHCADENNLENCPNADCPGRPIRHMIQILKAYSRHLKK